MDLYFIRHGQGEHTLNLPESLQIADTIINQFPQYLIVEGISPSIWKAGINCISEVDFLLLSRQFIDWCRTLQKQRLRRCYNILKNPM